MPDDSAKIVVGRQGRSSLATARAALTEGSPQPSWPSVPSRERSQILRGVALPTTRWYYSGLPGWACAWRVHPRI